MLKNAHKIWKKFKCKDGSRHIASPVAIAGLIRWLKYEKPHRVLEIGAGIGTLTYSAVITLNSLFPARNYVLISVENNEFCLNELEKNLRGYKENFSILQNVEEIPANSPDFDFCIVDGGAVNDPHLFSKLSRHAFIFIEGNRQEQSETLEEFLSNQLYIKADIRNLQLRKQLNGEKGWIKGYRIYKLNPNFSHRIIFLWLNLKTSFVYRWRSFAGNFQLGKTSGKEITK